MFRGMHVGHDGQWPSCWRVGLGLGMLNTTGYAYVSMVDGPRPSVQWERDARGEDPPPTLAWLDRGDAAPARAATPDR